MEEKEFFINPDIESSYREMCAGKHLYNAIIETNAKKIIDFGVLNGYSTVCMAQAAKKTGGKIIAYDLFEDYEFNNSNLEIFRANIQKYNVENIVEIKKMSFYDWILLDEDFDILHVDISNTGETIDKLWNKFSGAKDRRIFFEGGSLDRDRQDWMIKYGKTPFNRNNSQTKFKVLQESSVVMKGRLFYPSISELLINNY